MEKATNVSAGLELIFISEKLTAVIFDTALELFCRGIILPVSLFIDGCIVKNIYPLVDQSSISAKSALDLSREMLRVQLDWHPILGNRPAKLRHPQEAPMTMWLGPVFMGGLGLIFGIFPDGVGHWLIEPAVRAFHPTMEDIELKLFYGINEPLLLSIATLSLGGMLYRIRRRLRQFIGIITVAVAVVVIARSRLLAVWIGTMVAALILSVAGNELDRSLADFFEANSYIAAHGRNIVNVILFDFRSFNTLGEITVVTLAGLAGYALVQKRKVN
jgi:multisubunit Na+/H+ antiporter MnhB subunit